MADNFTHRLNAENALEIAGYTPRHRNAFILGANGPDIFYYYQIYSPVDRNSLWPLADAVHRTKTGLFLKTMFSMAQTNVQKDYCLGFLCHYSLDSIIHPYVQYVSEAYGSPFNIACGHEFFESAIDSQLSLEKFGTNVADNTICVPEISEFDVNQITYLLKRAVSEVYPDFASLTQDEYRQAIKDIRFMKKFFISPTRAGHLFVGALEKMHILREGLGTSHMQPCTMKIPRFPLWENMCEGTYSVETLPEMLRRADYKSAEYIQTGLKFFDGKITRDEFRREIGSVSYNTGLTVE